MPGFYHGIRRGDDGLSALLRLLRNFSRRVVFIGRLLPKSWFHGDKFPYRCASWEAKLFRFLRVHEWQDKVPDMSKIVPKLIPAKKLGTDFRAQLPRMIEETCVAEFTHFVLILLGFYALRLWPGTGGAVVTAIYILFGNLPFLIIQRYNRPRLQKLLAAQQRRSRRNQEEQQ